jgi:hypothetical protein
MTGRRRYLLQGWAEANAGPGLYEVPGDEYSHYVNWYPFSYALQQSLYLLDEMAELKQMPPMRDVPYRGSGPGTGGLRVPDAVRQQPNLLTILMPEREDTSFHVGTRYRAYKDVNYRFIDPTGEFLREGTILRKTLLEVGDHYRFGFEQPRDQVTGTYRLELSGLSRYAFWYADSCSLGTHRYVVPEGEHSSVDGSGRWFFRVPADCEEFTIRLGTNVSPKARCVLEVIDPDDRPVARGSVPSLGEPVDLVVEPRRRHRGRVWAVAMEDAVIVDVSGIPRWFAATPAGCEE